MERILQLNKIIGFLLFRNQNQIPGTASKSAKEGIISHCFSMMKNSRNNRLSLNKYEVKGRQGAGAMSGQICTG